MTETEKKELKDFLRFVEYELYGDSPHTCDPETSDWFHSMMHKVKTIVLPEERIEVQKNTFVP